MPKLEGCCEVFIGVITSRDGPFESAQKLVLFLRQLMSATGLSFNPLNES